jgi:5-methylcytosine-specific restriction endonuclease McrA
LAVANESNMEVFMDSVLLLNASFSPLSIIPMRRALSLIARGCVEAATEETITIQGVSRPFHLPTVIRLQRYVNVPQRKAVWGRSAVLNRDAYRCIYCGVQSGVVQSGRILQRDDFTLDHIIPRSRGGRNTWGNTACACYRCNQRKADRTPHEAGMPMLWEPKTPRVSYVVAEGEVPDAWKVYLRV